MINSTSVNFNKINIKSSSIVNKYKFKYKDKIIREKISENKSESEIIHYDKNGKKTGGHLMVHKQRGLNFYKIEFITDANGIEHKLISKKNNELTDIEILPNIYKQYNKKIQLIVKLEEFGIYINTSNENTVKVYKQTREIKIFNKKNKLIEEWKLLENGTIVLNNIKEKCIYVYYADKDILTLDYNTRHEKSYELDNLESLDLRYEYDEYGLVSSYSGINTKNKFNDNYIEYLYPAALREYNDYYYKNILFYDKVRLDDNGNIQHIERILINDVLEKYL